jgi:hypothetical protein
MPLIKIVPNFDREGLASLLGRKDFAKLSYSVSQKINKLTNHLTELLHPQLHFQIVPVSGIGNRWVELGKSVRFESLKLSKSMTGCSEAVCFAATIGRQIEDEISDFMKKKQLSEAYILDSMGSLAVESIVKNFWQNMSADYQKKDRAISIRFSPGYCDWHISEQKKLFHFIDNSRIQVSLSEYFLMSPRKSISGIFGISDLNHAEAVSTYNPCQECKKLNCNERRDCL